MNDEYIVRQNQNGGYDLILKEVGLDAHEKMDLINEIKTKGVIPVQAEVTTYILDENTQKFTNEMLQHNYDMSVNPDAEPDLKPFEQQHKTR